MILSYLSETNMTVDSFSAEWTVQHMCLSLIKFQCKGGYTRYEMTLHGQIKVTCPSALFLSKCISSLIRISRLSFDILRAQIWKTFKFRVSVSTNTAAHVRVKSIWLTKSKENNFKFMNFTGYKLYILCCKIYDNENKKKTSEFFIC